MALKFQDLKRGLYKSQYTGDLELERYIIENETDLKLFKDKFPMIKNFSIENVVSNDLEKGRVIIATDCHKMTGYPTYCFEASPDDNNITAMHRIKLL